MTRAQRLKRMETRNKEKLELQRLALAEVQSQLRAEDRKQLHKRYVQVGMLVDAAGLFVLDDATLRELFTLLMPLTKVPNPVAVLEALLAEEVLQ